MFPLASVFTPPAYAGRALPEISALYGQCIRRRFHGLSFIYQPLRAENLSQIAVLDIAGLLFGFSVYMGMLGQVENGEKIDPGKLFSSAIRTPAFIASVLGIIAGLTGVVQKLLAGPFAGTYTSVENILTTSITSVILLVVGFSIEFDKKLLSPCIRTIVLRILLQAVMIGECCWQYIT